MEQNLTIVMYHYVRDLAKSRYPQIKGLDLNLFREQLRFFQSRYNVVSCAQVLDALAGGALPENSLLLTFDDGYIDHYTNVFPLLKQYGMAGFFSMPGKILEEQRLLDVNKIHFILAAKDVNALLPMVFERLDHYRGLEYPIPDNHVLYEKLAVGSRFDTPEVIFVKRLLQVELEESLRNRIVDDLFAACIGLDEDMFAKELYMSMDQVRFMKREGMEWGIHGYEHYWMNRLSDQALREDIGNALDVFSGVVDRQGWLCCYPYGSHSPEVIRTAKEMGAVGGFSTRVAIARLGEEERFVLPRLDTNDFPPKSDRYLEVIAGV